MGREDFQIDAHVRAMEHGKLEGKTRKEEAYKTVRSEVEVAFTLDQCCGIERSTNASTSG
eukprot:1666527-Ditylum_brightwellii.AAC.1